MKTGINGFTLIENLSGVESTAFTSKYSTNFIGIYPNDNNINLDENSSDTDIIKELSDQMDFNPDGWLVFVNKEHEDVIQQLVKTEFTKALNLDDLNFTNGDLCESVLFHKVSSGVILEMFDPECFSPFLEQLVTELKKIDKNLLAFDIPHMSSNVCELVNSSDGKLFLDILAKNNIQYAQ